MIWVVFAEVRRSRCDGLTWVGRIVDADQHDDVTDLAEVFAGPRLRVQRELSAAAEHRKVRWVEDPRDPDRFVGQHADRL